MTLLGKNFARGKCRTGKHKTHEWYYGGYVYHAVLGSCIVDDNGRLYPVIEQTVGQYVGDEDCNGVMIYEGDIVHDETADWVVDLQTWLSLQTSGDCGQSEIYPYIRIVGCIHEPKSSNSWILQGLIDRGNVLEEKDNVSQTMVSLDKQ